MTLITFASVTLTLLTMPSKSAVTDSRGVFRMTGVLVGRYTIQISCMGYQPATHLIHWLQPEKEHWMMMPNMIIPSGMNVLMLTTAI